MNTIHAAAELHPRGGRVCVAIGFFDGVHLGHQQIIRQTVQDARQHEGVALVVTFDRHPKSVVAPDRAPRLIYSVRQKLRVIESLGVDSLLMFHFDEAFSRVSGEDFVRSLARDLGRVRSICVGANFVFGYRRGGSVDLLKRLGAELHFEVRGIAAVSLDDQAVSSTRIREMIQTGNLDAASQMLGRAYSIAGVVARGDGLGRQLGFPTANLDASDLILPPNGVYVVHARADDRNWRAVLNIGRRPTLQSPRPELRVEAHLIDFAGDLYGEEIEVTFVEKLRDERKFPSLQELRAQIARDILEAQLRF
jgi:riboflavin kinase/FMN adenylyltransferase